MGSQTLSQQLLPTGVEIPPGRRHLDRKAMVPQIVGDLTVGVGARVGPKRAPTSPVEASRRLEQSDHRELAQIIEGMGGATGEVAGDLVRQVQVGQGQGMGCSVRVARPVSTGPRAAVPEAEGKLLITLVML